MIPKNIRPGATAEGLTGETRQFTIKANGKAFRSLIDSLYTNKVLAVVRELCSNAHDSHVEAGQTRPFDVQIPTQLSPIFSVRDYGIGMSHDDVMVLYTTIFESTKEDSNDYTGQLGLGSKAPFAYTDSFSVISYTGNEMRLYLTHLATDGIPCITHVGTEPSDEPRGVEVSFAAKRESIKQFQKEMRFVSMGYDTPPNVTGMELALPVARMKGNGWAIYPTDAFEEMQDGYTRHFIRMGSALYPSSRNFPNVSGSFTTITNIPIGAANVTSSRDALSYDVETTAKVREVHEVAYKELVSQMEADVAKAVTRRGIAAAWGKYTGILTNLGGNSMVSLLDKNYEGDEDDQMGGFRSRPGDTIQQAAHFGKAANARRTSGRYASALDVGVLGRMTLIVDDQFNKLVRRKARIQNFANVTKMGHPVYVFSAYDTKQLKKGLAWIKECFELNADQIVKVADLVDVPPVRKLNPNGTPRVAGPRALAPGQYWMHKSGGLVTSDLYGTAYRKGRYEWPHRLSEALGVAGLNVTWDDILWVNDLQMERMTKKGLLPESRKLDIAAKAMIEKKAKAAPVEMAIEFNTIKEAIGRYNEQVRLIIDQFFPHVKINEDQAGQALGLARAVNMSLDLQFRTIRDNVNARVKELAETYPLLFQKTDRRHYEQYITAINTAQKEAATS